MKASNNNDEEQFELLRQTKASKNQDKPGSKLKKNKTRGQRGR